MSPDLANCPFYQFGLSSASHHSPKPDLSTESCVRPPACEVADYLVFDTESSGLTARDVAVQVAVGLYDENGVEIEFIDRLLKLPTGVYMNKRAVAVHRITASRLNAEGLDAAPELSALMHIFSRMRARGKRIVAHNVSFDVRILAQTASRHGVSGWNLSASDCFCTMQNAKHRCGLASEKTGRPKAPTNAELYKCLTGSEPGGALHDARVDVGVTSASFLLGAQRGWWPI